MIAKLICLIILILLSLPLPLIAGEASDDAVKLFETDDMTAARIAFAGILEENEKDHVAMYYLGRISLEEDDLDGAIDMLRNAVEADRENSLYHTWLGRAYISKLQNATFMEKGMLAGKALDNLKTAVKLDPDNVDARISLGGYYLNAPSIAGGSTKKALEQANEVVKHDTLEGNWMLARIHIKAEEFDAAIEKLHMCIDARPESVDYRYQLGALQQRLERYEDALGIFEEILVIDPQNRGALYQVGKTAALSGQNIERGIECMRNYLSMAVAPGHPGHDGAHWRLGMLLQHKRDLAAARTEFEMAVRLNPDEEMYQESLKGLDND